MDGLMFGQWSAAQRNVGKKKKNSERGGGGGAGWSFLLFSMLSYFVTQRYMEKGQARERGEKKKEKRLPAEAMNLPNAL